MNKKGLNQTSELIRQEMNETKGIGKRAGAISVKMFSMNDNV